MSESRVQHNITTDTSQATEAIRKAQMSTYKQPTSVAVEFFYQHGGWATGLGPATETAFERAEREERDHQLCAQTLAIAEQNAHNAGVTFTWEDDWAVGSHKEEYGPGSAYENGEPDTCETCLMIGPDGFTVLGSLGCIDDATPEYRRVVQAELASEVDYTELRDRTPIHVVDIPADYPVQPYHGVDRTGIVTCGYCLLRWDDSAVTDITPTPSGRCPFEAWHRH